MSDKSRIRAVLLMNPKLRIGALLAAANVERRKGEDIVYAMVRGGEVAMGPDSSLRIAAMNRRPGRPPRAAKPSTERFEMRITAAELRAWERRAKADGLSLSDWARGLLNYEVTQHE